MAQLGDGLRGAGRVNNFAATKSIQTQILAQPSEENGHRCIVKAVVEVEKGRFEALGDADPGNVEDRFAPHLIRVAETRAKARALRDAVNHGIVSFEELDGASPTPESSDPGSGASPPRPSTRIPRSNGPARSSAPARSGSRNSDNGPEAMTEAQRRYLFRLVAGQGFQRQAAEERLKDLLHVGSLSEATKAQAMEVIDQLLQQSPQSGGSRSGAAPF